MSDINVCVTSDLTSSERRISPQWDLHYLKTKLELITGIAPQHQTIHHYPSPSSNEYRVLSSSKEYSKEQDISRRVSEFEIAPFSRLHVLDDDENSQLKELGSEEGQFQEFKLSAEEYAKRDNTVLSWKKKNKLGRFNPEYVTEQEKLAEENKQVLEQMSIGSRCRIINIQGERRGTVKFVGKINELDEGKDIWVGVEFDEPVGKNDGLIDGRVLFECRKGHGILVKPIKVEVGDFPELDPFASDDDEI